MDLTTIFDVVDISELSLYLGIDDLISLFLVCRHIRCRIHHSLSLICDAYCLSSRATSFPQLVYLYDTEKVSRRSAEIIGLNRSLIRAATIDSLSLVQLFLSKGASHMLDVLTEACKMKSINVMNYLVEHTRDRWSSIEPYITILATYGHLDIVKSIMEENIEHYGACLIGGIKGGHRDIIDFAYNTPAVACTGDAIPYISKVICEAMETAAECGNIDVVKTMLKLGANNYCDAMSVAADNGHIDIVRLMIECGANTYTSLSDVCTYDEDIAKLMRDSNIFCVDDYTPYIHTVHTLQETFKRACRDGDLGMVKSLLNDGDLHTGLNTSIIHCHIDIVKLLLSRWNQPSVDGFINISRLYATTSITELLESYKAGLTT